MTTLDDDGLYHLISEADWEAVRHLDEVTAESLATEGFVHCSWGRQVAGTLAKHFPGRTDLLALRLDAEAVAGLLVEEDSYGSGQTFPHLYGPIPAAAVTEAIHL